MNQSREAHRSAWPLHSPEGGQSAAVCAADWPTKGMTSRNSPFQTARGTRVACVGVSPGHGRPEREQPGYGAC
jgi:hypothetical protein